MTWQRDQTPVDSQCVSDTAVADVLDCYVAALQGREGISTSRFSVADAMVAECRRYAGLLAQLDDARRVLFEDSNVEFDEEPASPRQRRASAFDEFEGTERFHVIRRIGSGGMGVVYEAFDQERQMVVALKTLYLRSESLLGHLKREFRSLSNVIHPHLVTLYEMSCSGDRWFFTMEFVDGRDLLSHVRDRDGAVNYRLVRECLRQLIVAVSALHQAGHLHRDLKPSNVLVTAEGRLVVLDFGLVTDLRDRSSVSVPANYARGTLPYMSPEQLDGQPLTTASDWYSVGVILHMMLTGRVPFQDEGRQLTSVAQLSSGLLRPAALSSDAPADLKAACVGFLRAVPEQRLTPAEALKLIGVAPELPAVEVSDTRPCRFIGRCSELVALREAFELAEWRCVTFNISGSSGIGKTALVAHFLDGLTATEPKAIVFRGRCHQQESVPFNAVDELIDSLSRHLRRLPCNSVPSEMASAVKLFPGLRLSGHFRRTRSNETDDAVQTRRKAFGAIRELFAQIATDWRLVLFIDDFQWADADSATLLREILLSSNPPRLLLITCNRSDIRRPPLIGDSDINTHSQLLRREIVLAPLDRSESLTLVESALGRDLGFAPELLQRISREAGGIPFFLLELQRYYQVRSNASESQQHSLLEEAIWQRIESHPESVRKLLEIVAIAGCPIRQRDLLHAVNRVAEASHALHVLRVAHLIRMDGPTLDDAVEPYHDRIRDSVLSHLTATSRRQHYLSLAMALEQSGSDEPALLADQFLSAGEPLRASRYAIAAAGRADAKLAFDQAACYFRIALEHGEHSSDDQRDLRIGKRSP